MSSDATPIICPACDGAETARPSCVICDGLGAISADRRADWERERVRRVSTTHVAFAQLAGDLSGRLEQRRTLVARALAEQGRRLEQGFARWATEPPTDTARRALIAELTDWNRAALDLLAGGRTKE